MSTIPHFPRMVRALEIEAQSDHPNSKVGSVLCGHTQDGQEFEIGRANYWPEILKAHIPSDQKLGNASTTVHAEIAVLLYAPVTESSVLYVTDLPCPNCAKMMVEARIETLYIDTHAKESELGQKMRPFFESVSRVILQAGGIKTYEIDTKSSLIRTLIEVPKLLMRNEVNPIHLEAKEEHISFDDVIARQKTEHGDQSFACALGKNRHGDIYVISSTPQRSMGLSPETAQAIIEIQNKYTAILQPLDRVLIVARRYGLQLIAGNIYISQVPTSREFVNFIGAGFSALRIGDEQKCRDDFGLQAYALLRRKSILSA